MKKILFLTLLGVIAFNKLNASDKTPPKGIRRSASQILRTMVPQQLQTPQGGSFRRPRYTSLDEQTSPTLPHRPMQPTMPPPQTAPVPITPITTPEPPSPSSAMSISPLDFAALQLQIATIAKNQEVIKSTITQGQQDLKSTQATLQETQQRILVVMMPTT